VRGSILEFIGDADLLFEDHYCLGLPRLKCKAAVLYSAVLSKLAWRASALLITHNAVCFSNTPRSKARYCSFTVINRHQACLVTGQDFLTLLTCDLGC
jgi:hypothetical protein